jgi:hypothetical protein
LEDFLPDLPPSVWVPPPSSANTRQGALGPACPKL